MHFPGHVAMNQAVAVRPRPPGFPVDGAGGSDHQYAAWSASNQQILRSTPASSPATNPAP
ncbi:MAG TPA: hypothetical protein VJY33_10690 [Isosphaeraceae bacterium]|nr:hypothetical protein [Isosphaeraceae bacterium]